MVQLENIFREMGEKSLPQELCQELANSFRLTRPYLQITLLSYVLQLLIISCRKRSHIMETDSHCFDLFEFCTKLDVLGFVHDMLQGWLAFFWEFQVQDWFENKQKESQAKITSPANSLKLLEFSSASHLSNGLETSPNPKDEGVPDLSELAFEARSSKDLAWYDVESFLTYRVVSSGELEVRVRFAGFGKNQDEWVNVKESVRERSIPLVPSECHKVKVGDLMLCFQEREDYAVYCDAHVVKVQRRLHDHTECRCIFIVRYHHDDSEEVVQWNRLCRRPTQEKPVVYLNPIADLWG